MVRRITESPNQPGFHVDGHRGEQNQYFWTELMLRVDASSENGRAHRGVRLQTIFLRVRKNAVNGAATHIMCQKWKKNRARRARASIGLAESEADKWCGSQFYLGGGRRNPGNRWRKENLGAGVSVSPEFRRHVAGESPC